MKIIVNRFAPSNYVVNVFGLIWTRPGVHMSERLINHERIHTAQQRELLWVPFYILYLLEWTVRLIIYRNRDKAYRNISFETEAYSHQADLKYLKHRRHFAQWRKHYEQRKP
ncbi:MAG: hypothetical protein NC402_02235 [Prevotella sp.]|nr:hypothetical protein [Prevotella sp.]MCM1074618.1 hypothetical protein [Ruminococcus sp.]